MTTQLTIGSFTVTSLDDGVGHLPPSAYPGADFAEHAGLLDATGTYRIRMGAFLVRGPSGTVLVDAGAGEGSMPFPQELAELDGLTDPPEHLMTSGRLPRSLAEVGVSPGDVDAVLLTHLHLDHVGWLMRDGAPFFPNATVHHGFDDWAALVTSAAPDDPARQILEAAQRAGVLRPFPGPEVTIAPGIRAVHTPGHTPGSYVVELESGGERLWFVGDLVEHPGQLTDPDIHFMTDVDRSAAQRARVRVFEQARRDGIVIATAHLADPVFRRISADRTWVDAAA